jgi:hypothetical protein
MVYFASVLGPTFVIEMLGMPRPGPYGIVLHKCFLDLTNHRPHDCIIRAIPLLAGPHAGSFLLERDRRVTTLGSAGT